MTTIRFRILPPPIATVLLTSVLFAILSLASVAVAVAGQPQAGSGEIPPIAQTQTQTQAQDGDRARPLAVVPHPARVTVLIELQQEPAARTYAAVVGPAVHVASTLGLDAQTRAAAARATRAQVDRIASEQQRLASTLASPRYNARELFRVQRAMNALAVTVNAADITAIGRLPGVKAVRLLVPERPTNAQSVPFIGAPELWGNSLGLGLNVTGAGVRVGIIDTGVDYQHATFGGAGRLADYQANNRTVAPDAFFPTAKVAGGWDFAGDAYDGTNSPVPDADPMDCNGHGTHVAGTAGGFGVKSDGSTFTGPYNTAVPFSSLRIGPGVAPQATLYALRVFGCGGSTNLTIQGIDWAMDPNGDNDLSDHLDVINMSLGSDFGGLADTTAIAADNAAAAGIIVVASAGNAGDTYFISGSPGSGNRVIATASTIDNRQTSGALFVGAPAGIAGTYLAMPSTFGATPSLPGVTGNVVLALDAADGAGPLTTDACSVISNAGAVAGNIALVDRGNCSLTTKVQNAQNAGAIAVIINNTAAGAFVPPSGSAPAITIPSSLVRNADGNAIKASLPGVIATLAAGPSGDTLSTFSSRGPRGGGTMPIGLKPDIAAPGQSIVSARTGVTCTSGAIGCLASNPSGYNAGSQALVLSGTSMAAPHMAGVMALLRQLHPDWPVEELKAVAMNSALHDVTEAFNGIGHRYGPGRIGAGRVDPALAAQSPVAAFNAEDPGTVSVSFDGAVEGTATRTKTVRLVNHGATPQAYDLAIDTSVDAPGVAYSLPGGTSVTVPPGQSVSVVVGMTGVASQMTHTRDSTVSATQIAPSPLSGEYSREWLTEEAGYLTFSQGGTMKLRVPLYAAPIPVSAMHADDTLAIVAPTGSASIALAGVGVCTATLAGSSCSGASAIDEVSLVTPVELQVVSPADPANVPGAADLQYAGVGYDSVADRIYFGVSTWQTWGTPNDVAFNIYIDSGTPDGTWDYVLFNSSTGMMAVSLFGNVNADPQDAFVTGVYDIAAGTVSPQLRPLNESSTGVLTDSRVFNNRVAVLVVSRAALGISGPFRYKIETCPGWSPLCGSVSGFHYDRAAGPFTWDYQNPGLTFGGARLVQDLDGGALPYTWSLANIAARGTLGALLLHYHNAPAGAAEVVTLAASGGTDLGLTMSASPTGAAPGTPVTLTIVLANHGANLVSGLRVSVELPDGLTYVSDDSGGSYNSSTDMWSIAPLSAGGSATLHLVVTQTSARSLNARAVIASASLLDPNPNNNVAVLGLTAPPQADLQITAAALTSSTVANSPVGYTVSVKNAGNDPAYGIVIANSVANSQTPGVVPITSGTPSTGLFTAATGEWRIASLAKGGTATLTFSALAAAGPALVAQASASSTVADPHVANNVATATVIITPRATVSELSLSRTSVMVDETSVLTASVTDTATVGTKQNPTGIVTFASSSPEDTFTSASCVLAAVAATIDKSSCTVTITAATIGDRTLTAVYAATGTHAAASATRTLTATHGPYTYLLAEGATGPFFDTDILLANPNTAPAPVNITFIKEGGSTITLTRTLPPQSRTTIRADDVSGLEWASFATTVVSTAAHPLIVERTMSWDSTGYGSHTEKASEGPATTWYFAEGSQGFFSTYFLLLNPHATPNTAHVTYFREGEPEVHRTYPMGPSSRVTVDAGADAELRYRAFGVQVVFDQPGAAERSMYFGKDPLWVGGHEAAGVTSPATSWYLAEGATGSYFTTFLLLANPNATDAQVTISYLPATGIPVSKPYTVPAHQRKTLNVGLQEPSLVSAAVGAHVESDIPILVERAQYWPAPNWFEAHASAGMNDPGLKWGLAEGRVGGARRNQTYILLMNPGAQPADVTVTFLRARGAPLVKTFKVAPTSRFNVGVIGAGSVVPELTDESFGAVIESTQPIVVERSMYSNANGVVWASGTNATASRLP